MDLDEWEFIPNDGFLEFRDDGGNNIFSRKYARDSKNSVFNMNYFTCPSPNSQKFVESTQGDSRIPKQLVPLPIHLQPNVPDQEIVKEINKASEKISDKIMSPSTGVEEADQESVSQVFFRKMKENEFVDMKLDSPKSGSRGILSQIEEKGETLEGKNCLPNPEKEVGAKRKSLDLDVKEEEVISWEESNDDDGLNIWKWSLNGIGAICSFGVAAAATICIIALGSGPRNKPLQENRQKHQFEIFADDKRMKQVVQQASRLSEAISAVGGGGGVPLNRAHITVGGYYDGL